MKSNIMKLPESVNRNTYLAYKPEQNIEIGRKILSENFKWNYNQAKPLVSLSIEKLAEQWKGELKLEQLISKDREYFFQILDTNIPLQMLVDNIKNDIFWKRCYYSKWLEAPLVSEDKKWINIFMEKYYADVLENMNPRLYDPEKVNALVMLCGSYIQKLSIRSLVPSDIPMHRTNSPEMANLITSQNKPGLKSQMKNVETISRDHISLHAALGSLTNLVDLNITYQLRIIKNEYRQDQFQFTINDAKNLSRGLEKCIKLKTLRITRSDMNCIKVKYILRALSDSQNLETLDFSHCKIGDDGASAIAKFIMKHTNLRNLILADNIFGPLGAENISHSLNQPSCGVRNLDLRLNTKLGSEGIAHIAVSIARGCSLTILNISGCGIKSGPLIKSPAGVWSTTSAEHPPACGDLLARAIGLVKTPLRSLDISVNDIGSPSDITLSNAICLSYIVDVNLKRSGMGQTAMIIAESAAAAQRLRREAEKGIKFNRSAGRLLQARRVARGMNIDADPLLIAQQLSARPSIVSIASEEGTYNIQTQPLPSDFGFVPVLKKARQSDCASPDGKLYTVQKQWRPPEDIKSFVGRHCHTGLLIFFFTPRLKSPLPSSRTSSITGPSTSRRSSHHTILEPVNEVRRTALIRRGSDGSLLNPRKQNNSKRHIKIFVS